MSHCAFANISISLENNPAEEEEAVHSMSIARTLQTFIFHKKTIICIFDRLRQMSHFQRFSCLPFIKIWRHPHELVLHFQT